MVRVVANRISSYILDVYIYVYNGRQCNNCSLNVVEDEYHVVFDCTFYNSLREDKRFSMIFKRQERKSMIAFITHKKTM